MSIIRKIDRANKFISLFVPETGFYVRSGVIENGEDTGVDPFMSSAPELLDIGIKGHCDHAKYCTVGCYQGGMDNQMPDMTLDDYKLIIDQVKGKAFQIALGGHGDPPTHENFKEILEYTRQNDIIPNLTTSGFKMNDYQIALIKEYCGACAVSWYDQHYTYRALHRLISAGVKTNIHYVVSENTIDNAIDKLRNNIFYPGINAVIFLLYKPVGAGVEDNVLRSEDKIREFFVEVEKKHPFKIGFDSCFIQGVLNYTTSINKDSIDTCEGARYSGYISSDMVMTPCSFDQGFTYGVSLRDQTLDDAWHSEQFEAFRSHFKSSCSGCGDRLNCLGGCPLMPSNVLCKRGEKSNAV